MFRFLVLAVCAGMFHYTASLKIKLILLIYLGLLGIGFSNKTLFN